MLAGGTDLYPQHVGRALRGPIIDIGGLDELRGIDATAVAYRIGALTRWSDVAAAALPACFDGLRAAARRGRRGPGPERGHGRRQPLQRLARR